MADRLFVWTSACAMLVAGCGGDEAPSGGATPTGIAAKGRVVEFAAGQLGSETPIAGMQVCVLDRAEIACATSGADGTFTLADIPKNTELALSLQKQGYLNTLRLGTSADADLDFGDTRVATDQIGQAFTQVAGGDPDAGAATGAIHFFALHPVQADGGMTNQVFEGFTVSLSPDSGTGPVYANTGELPDATLTQSSTAGWGAWVNVPPGDYEVTFSASGQTCTVTPAGGWKSSKPNTLKTRAVASYLTSYMFALCQ